MTILDQVLQANRCFIEKLPTDFIAASDPQISKTPSRHLAIFTCMDTRLVDFLEPAMGIERGEAKVIKNAGNTITGPFESAIRSLLVGIFELDVTEVMVIGHYDCGVAHTTTQSLVKKMLARGICPDAIKMIHKELETWLDEVQHPNENVKHAVEQIRMNPLIPKDVPIHGLMFEPHTGELEIVVNGYETDREVTTCNC
jgi:carbonic anhydrase